MKLQEWLEDRGMPAAEFARRVGVHRCTVHAWLNNIAHPTYSNYLKIKGVTNGKVTYEEMLQA